MCAAVLPAQGRVGRWGRSYCLLACLLVVKAGRTHRSVISGLWSQPWTCLRSWVELSDRKTHAGILDQWVEPWT